MPIPRDPLGIDGPDPNRAQGPWGDPNELPPIVRVTPWGGWFPGTVPIDANSGALVTLAAAGPYQSLVAYTVPQNHNAVITAWGGELTQCDAWTEVAWQLRRNGSSVLTLPATGQLLGVMPSELSPVRLELQGGDIVEVYADPGATQRVGRARLVGYEWPALAAERT